MAGRAHGPTTAEIRQFLEDGIETAVKTFVGFLRNEDIFEIPTGEDAHIALGYAKCIRDDPTCQILHYEGNINAKTPKGPKRWHASNDPDTTRGQWNQEFSIEANPGHTWEYIFEGNGGERPIMPKVWRGDITGPNQNPQERKTKADNDCMAAKRDLYCWLGGLLNRNDSVTALTKCTELMKAANNDMGWECYKMISNDFLAGAVRFCQEYMAQAVPGGRPPKVTQEYPGFVPQQPWTNPNDNHQASRTTLATNLARVARKN